MKGLGTRQHPEQNMLREEVWFGGSHRLLEIFFVFFLLAFVLTLFGSTTLN